MPHYQGRLNAVTETDGFGDDAPMATDLKGRIRARLKELNLSPRAASLRAGLGDTAIKAILNDRSRNPTIHTLAAIAEVLDIPVDDLLASQPRGASRGRDKRTGMGDGAPSNVRYAPDAPVPPGPGAYPLTVRIVRTAEGDIAGTMQVHFQDEIGFAPRLPALSAQGRDIHALYMQGASMAPWRQPGELIYVTGDRPASPGCHVLVMLGGPSHGAPDESMARVARLVRQTARELVLEQYQPQKDIIVPRAQIRRLYRVIEWQELMGAA